MVVKLSLRKTNKYALVDSKDYELVKNFKWYLLETANLQYAIATIRCINGVFIKPLTYKEIALRRKKTINRWNNISIYPDGSKKRILIHRLIMNPPKGMEIDHKNGNGLDNRRSNLRICTREENGRHRKLSILNTSGYHGVHYCKDSKRRKRWMASIRINKKKTYLGRYYTKEEAAEVYKHASLKYHKEFSIYN